MMPSGDVHITRSERRRLGRKRSEKIETVLIVALAGLVLFKGAPVLAGIGLGIAEMMWTVMRP